MKVRVQYTVEVNDDYRRAIRAYHGMAGLATRQEVAAWFKTKGRTMDDDIMHDMPDEEGD